MEHSKLHHGTLHFQKSVRQWWTNIQTKGIAPHTWKECKQEIMKKFLTKQEKDDFLMAWWGLTLEKGEIVHKYIGQFWDLHLKAIVFKKIDFSKQKQQLCVGLNNDMKASMLKNQRPYLR